ncbi:hypothetical protein GOP47_0028648 [Adiantum capillus-veneris]|nr:hypothetical protein GOP47_0028648 [Adiantum capillus-veneris]
MGKRRDRRQQQTSSRRVKLDLSMDDVLPPSETPGSLEELGSALGKEVKADVKNQEAANENPLSLLGQYSDDEADEDDEFGAGFSHDINIEGKKDTSKDEDEQGMAQKQESGNLSLEEKEYSTGIIGSNRQVSQDSLISDMRVEAPNENEWQPVLDDDSGEYYYWNVQTGETTWVKPVESGSADEPGSFTDQPVDLDTSSLRSPKQSPNQGHSVVDHGESTNGGRRSPSEISRHPEKAKTSFASTEVELNKSDAGLILDKNDPAGDAAMASQKLENAEDPETAVGFFDLVHERVDHEGKDLKEEDGEKDEKENLPKIKDDRKDLKIESASDIQGAPEKIPQNIETGNSPKNFIIGEVTQIGQTTAEEAQGASGCISNPMPSVETRTIEEQMTPLLAKVESLHHRLNVLAREAGRGVSRHAFLASQTEARLTDWKTFCALGFSLEACLSFIQRELTQLELVLAAEEANESERQKSIASTSNLEASHELRSEVRDSDWSLNWAYYQQDNSAIVEPWKQGQPTKYMGNGDDVEEGEIQTSYTYPAYGGVHEASTGVDAQIVGNDIGTEDVDMDVDMEVDDEVEMEPAVPGMNSDVPAIDVPVPYSYPYPLPGSNDVSALAPLDATCLGEPTPYFHTGISGDAWAPPLPPDDEWAPPPPGESEPAPPPPPDDPPPLPPQSPQVIDTLTLPLISSEVQLQYFVPGYTLENNGLPQCVSVTDYQSAVDSSVYGSYVEGGIYSNCSQSTETLKIQQPYVLASGSTAAFNGWTAPVITSTTSVLVNPVSSEAPAKATSYASSAPTAIPMAADSNVTGATSETKKLGKGKIKKRTHAVAAAPMLNKKVSSLVNKWKQAKEELHGGEDEDDEKALFDVETLMKKRQKEIEEWRRQQIASGEALDNANFQPLGTLDWRERVKRARKADSKEGKEGTPDSVASLSMVEGQNIGPLKSKTPNLTDLSKGLPAGWQAYWDEASGEVYYGNLITQETTWDRPVT